MKLKDLDKDYDVQNLDVLTAARWTSGSGHWGTIVILVGSDTALTELDGDGRAKTVEPLDKAAYEAEQLIKNALDLNAYSKDEEVALRRKGQRASIEMSFRDVGLDSIYVEELPNGYHPKDPYFSQLPWYSVTTRLGHFIVGWRKHVIHLGWERTVVAPKPAKNDYSDKAYRDREIQRVNYATFVKNLGVYAWDGKKPGKSPTTCSDTEHFVHCHGYAALTCVLRLIVGRVESAREARVSDLNTKASDKARRDYSSQRKVVDGRIRVTITRDDGLTVSSSWWSIDDGSAEQEAWEWMRDLEERKESPHV